MNNHPFVSFMASPLGRLARVVTGMVVIAWGLTAFKGQTGNVVAFLGLFPLFAGLLDVCLLAPLFGCPMSGKRIRGEA